MNSEIKAFNPSFAPVFNTRDNKPLSTEANKIVTESLDASNNKTLLGLNLGDTFGEKKEITHTAYMKTIQDLKSNESFKEAMGGPSAVDAWIQQAEAKDPWKTNNQNNHEYSDKNKTYYKGLVNSNGAIQVETSRGSITLTKDNVDQQLTGATFGDKGYLPAAPELKNKDTDGNGLVDDNDITRSLYTSLKSGSSAPSSSSAAAAKSAPTIDAPSHTPTQELAVEDKENTTEPSILKKAFAAAGLTLATVSSAYGASLQGKSLSVEEQKMYAGQFKLLGTMGNSDAYKKLEIGGASLEQQQEIDQDQKEKAAKQEKAAGS